MENLRAALNNNLRQNYQAKWYCPWSKLDSLINNASVTAVIRESTIKRYDQDEAIRTVLNGGKRVFATAVLASNVALLLKYIHHDHLQSQPLDAKLPFTLPELKRIIGVDSAVEFYRCQWHFAVPTFQADSSHRIFDRALILPFISSKRLGEGAQGVAYEMEIDSEHQPDGLEGHANNLVLVRKEMALSRATAEQESSSDDITALNMVRLLASYVYGDTYNLLFVKAEQDLEDLVTTPDRPPAWTSDDSLIQGLRGLCSAVAAFHQFSHPELGLELKGLHHDLKPENVLVNGDQFLLSDFGLSRLKDIKAKSNTLSKDVMGWYISPESESFEDGLQRRMIGQPSDIWALACILAVVLTYMRKGSAGVEEFRARRRHTLNNWSTCAFHCAGQVNPSVEPWLQELEYAGGLTIGSLIVLIRSALKIDPSERPNAASIASKMDFLALQSTFEASILNFADLNRLPHNLTVEIERKRLILFGRALSLDQIGRDWHMVQEVTMAHEHFTNIRDHFILLRQELDAFQHFDKKSPYPLMLVRRLRSHVDLLWNCLLPTVRSQLHASLRAEIVNTRDLETLQMVRGNLSRDIDYRNIGLAAAIRSMMILMADRVGQDSFLAIEASRLSKVNPKIGPFSSLEELSGEGDQDSQEVFVDWLTYDGRFQGSTAEELYDRLASIAKIMHDESQAAHFRALKCIGYFHALAGDHCGLVYALPNNFVAGDTNPPRRTALSLASLIRASRAAKNRPCIGDIFKLAGILSESVLRWHEVGWIHRGISAHAIVFFDIDPLSSLSEVTNPVFSGFQFSRPDDMKSVTLGPAEHPELWDYYHPSYLKNFARHRPEFDYYSLGLVLMEIGYWKTLDEIVKGFKGRDRSPERLQEWIIEHPVADLHMAIGSIYQKAVRKCLTFPDGKEVGTRETVSLDVMNEFRLDVLEQVQSCKA